jgi:hypothetical protein
LNASTHAFISFCLWSLKVAGPAANDEGVSTMIPAHEPLSFIRELISYVLAQKCTSRTFRVISMFCSHTQAQIANDTFEKDGISFCVCMSIPIRQWKQRIGGERAGCGGGGGSEWVRRRVCLDRRLNRSGRDGSWNSPSTLC